MEFRGVNIRLLQAVAKLAKSLDLNNPWSIARISCIAIGSHETSIIGRNDDGTLIYNDDGSLKNRWIIDNIFNLESCLTHQSQLSLIDLLLEFHSIIPHPLLNVTYDQVVGKKANVFVSFSYNSDYFELIDSIEQYFINNPDLNKDTTYFWIDMLVNNQWIALEKDFAWWTGTFKNAIGEIGSVILFLSDWYKGPLLRAWCIFELYCTVVNKCKFEVIMSESNQKIFLNNIICDPTDEINKMLSVIKSIKSSCFLDKDRIKIHGAIKEIMGFDAIDSMIFEQLRIWVIQTTLSQYNNEIVEIKKLCIMNCLAVLFESQGKYDQAEPLFVECLNKRKIILGDDHPDTLTSIHNLALLFESQGKYDQAEPLYVECLNKSKIILGDDHPDTDETMNNLAGLFESQGKYDQAEPLYVECLNRSKRILGDDHPSTLVYMNNLASLFESQGRYDQAEPLYVESLNKRKILLGDDHPNTLNSMNNLAYLFKSQGKNDQAEPLFVECLNKRKIIFGDDHPDTLTSIHNLAALFESQGKYDQAEPLYLECLNKRKMILGDDHPDTLRSMNNLAYLFKSQGKYDQAEPLYVECLNKSKIILGDDHPNTLSSMNNLAALFESQEKYDQAEPMYEEFLNKRKRKLGDDHPNTF